MSTYASPPNYPAKWIESATERGYDHEAHQNALLSNNEDTIALTHPANWLTEEEVEAPE